MRTLTGLYAQKHILAPIYGPIPITPIELKIISTPLFQRLRNITQLSMASLVFPGATHNRFQHCLGTLHVMDKMLYTLKLEDKLPQNLEDANRIIQKMRISALLHDCGHLPFSHTFENFYEESKIHENFGRIIVENSIISKILNSNKIEAKSIGALLTNNIPLEDPDVYYFTQLVPLLHSDADADRIDYLLRDAYFTGVPYGKIDIERICNFITVHDGKVCFWEKAQDALEDFLFARYQMYKIVYIHKTVICYELILQKLYTDYIMKYNDRLQLPFYLPKMDDFKKESENWFNESLYGLTESSFFNSIQLIIKSNKLNEKEKENLKELYSRITHRIPIKNCYRYDDLAESSKSEYCEKDTLLFDELEKIPNITNHWSFLRHDPSNPLKIASPIKGNIDDQQDYEQIRILKEKTINQKELFLLQNRTNSVIKSLARHHRILISYYHEDKKAQDIINQLANKHII